MAERHEPGLRLAESHQDWVRLRTLIFLRWTAIVGQLGAIFMAAWLYEIDLNLPLCLATVGASVAANLTAIFLYPKSRRLTQAELTAALLFDTVQLGALLALTGGLNNPFALLILVPVTIAATALQRAPTILLGVATIAVVTLAGWLHLPLVTRGGQAVEVPRMIEFGLADRL